MVAFLPQYDTLPIAHSIQYMRQNGRHERARQSQQTQSHNGVWVRQLNA